MAIIVKMVHFSKASQKDRCHLVNFLNFFGQEKCLFSLKKLVTTPPTSLRIKNLATKFHATDLCGML